MTFRTCSDEDRLLSAARAGELSAAHRAHLASCPSCAAALETERAMSALSGALAAEARSRLAPPEAILLRAKLRIISSGWELWCETKVQRHEEENAARVARGETPFLHVRAENPDAIRVYERLGFVARRELYVSIVANAPGRA